jgi:hypothetical protein
MATCIVDAVTPMMNPTTDVTARAIVAVISRSSRLMVSRVATNVAANPPKNALREPIWAETSET